MTEAKMADTGQYAHINEPVHHVTYLYDYAGQPWKTQQWVHKVEDHLYKPGPAGWLGERRDPARCRRGISSARWGFIRLIPGQPIYALGVGVRPRVFHLENGKSFTVEANRKAAADYLRAVGDTQREAAGRSWIAHDEIVNGGVLRFRGRPRPNESGVLRGCPRRIQQVYRSPWMER